MLPGKKIIEIGGKATVLSNYLPFNWRGKGGGESAHTCPYLWALMNTHEHMAHIEPTPMHMQKMME